MQKKIMFFVAGHPVPKQSFQIKNYGGGFQPQRVIDWEEVVALAAKQAVIADPDFTKLDGLIRIHLSFNLPDRRRRDFDNLSKGTVDALHQIIFHDDSQINAALIFKHFPPKDKRLLERYRPGVGISVEPNPDNKQGVTP